MSALLQVRRLRKCFGSRPLLDVEGLDLHANTLTALTGDNGSGKSTLLRILAGLEPADALDLEYAQCRIDGGLYPDQWRREIVYVHQHPYLFNTSIAANIEYGLKLRRVGASARRAASAQAMRWAGLDAVAAVPPQRLSGGEKQKVALARVKVLAPRVLLVDEPTANLDRAARAQIVALLRDSASTNNCVVVACHDREIIDLPGVKRLHLEGGKIVAC